MDKLQNYVEEMNDEIAYNLTFTTELTLIAIFPCLKI